MSPPADESVPRRPWRTVLYVAVPVLLAAVTTAVVISQTGDRIPAPAVTPTASGTPSVAVSSSPPVLSTSPTPSPAVKTPARATPSSRPRPSSSASTSRSNQSQPQPTRTPVPIKKPTRVKPGLTAKITQLSAVEGQAEGPGEVGGPAVRFKLTLTNSSQRAARLDTTVVNLFYGADLTPGGEVLHKPGGSPLPASVSPGGQAAGTYIFAVPLTERDDILITVDYSVDVSVTAFRGKAPR